jgi:hypothetical protein
MATIEGRMQQRRDTYANWVTEDPTLLAGEIAYVTDRDYYVIGDGTSTFSAILKAYMATVMSGLYNLEDIHDLSASALQIDFTNLTGGIDIWSQPDGYTYSIAWKGGDGTYQLTFDGGTYTGKTIGGVDADTLAADLAGDGQGRITFRKDGNDLRILEYRDEYNGAAAWLGSKTTVGWQKTASGRLEQEFRFDTVAASQTLTWMLPFVDANYQIAVAPMAGANDRVVSSPGQTATTIDLRGFDTSSNTDANTTAFVIAKGRWTAEYPEVG